jgi:ubiquitin C-terminal hydrolase
MSTQYRTSVTLSITWPRSRSREQSIDDCVEEYDRYQLIEVNDDGGCGLDF